MPTQLKPGEQLERSMSIDNQRAIDDEARTVEVAFSSEVEVERWFGIEILDHAPESIRLGRLQDGGAVLMDHTRTDQVGVVESVTIDADRKGRAQLRFSKSARGEEVFQDVKDGIRKHISVGYSIHKYERAKGENGAPDTIRVTDWEPYEISFVSVPADATVGVGRSADNEDNNLNELTEGSEHMPDPIQAPVDGERNQTTPAGGAAPAVINVDDVRAQERQRISDITEAARSAPFDLSELERKAIDQGMSLDQFRSEAFAVASSQPAPAAAAASQDMLERHDGEYSLVRALNAQLTGDWSDAGFEREMSQELVRIAQREGGGIRGGVMVPMSILGDGKRADTTGGAGLIGTAHLASQFIDTLRASTLMGRLGARFLSGLNGNVSIPKKTANATFGWLAEGADASASDVTVGNVTLSPKHVGGTVPLTFELMRQSNPAIEQLVRSDMLEGIALAIDHAAFNGSGASNQPLGLLNTAGVQTLTLADTAGKVPTWEEIVQMEGMLDDVEGLSGQLAYAFRPGIHSALKVAKKDAGSGRFVIEGNDCNGYMPYKSSQLPAKASLFGDYSQVMIGTWGMVELIPDRNVKTGGLDIGCHQLADVAVRRAEQFVKGV